MQIELVNVNRLYVVTQNIKWASTAYTVQCRYVVFGRMYKHRWYASIRSRISCDQCVAAAIDGSVYSFNRWWVVDMSCNKYTEYATLQLATAAAMRAASSSIALHVGVELPEPMWSPYTWNFAPAVCE